MGRNTLLFVLLLGCLLPAAAGADRSGEPVWYADLDADSLAALDDSGSSDPLTAILEAGVPFRFEHDRFTVYTDRRWYSSASGSGAGSPLMVLRRWPGDTVLALYGLPGNRCTPAGGAPDIAGGSFRPSGDLAGDEPACVWDGAIHGPSGDYPARWVERPVPDRPSRLGALLLPGDAGLGQEAIRGLMMELQATLGRVVVLGDRWPRQALPESTLIPPALGMPPGNRSEAEDPWQTALTTTFSLGLPPGLRAMRTDSGPGAALAVPGGLLWIRGRFTDRDDDLVAVGDPDRAGYVASPPGVDPEWPTSSRLPAGMKAGERIAVQDFEVVRNRTGAVAATAARWREEGFEGEWLVFRMAWPGKGIEIGLPMLAGRRSEALFWIPATLRPAGQPPAPPPLDPAERFGITFERLTGNDRKANPWMEGYLTVPGLRIEIPLDWYPVNALRTRNGFPVRLYDGDGRLQGTLQPLDESWFESFLPAEGGWKPLGRPGRFRALTAYRAGDGSGLFRARWGGGFLLRPEAGQEPGESWERMLGTVQMMRPGR